MILLYRSYMNLDRSIVIASEQVPRNDEVK